MPPKKKAKRSLAKAKKVKDPDEPLEYANYIREKAGKRFVSKKKNTPITLDIEQNIREIRALLTINDEIFGRCIKFMDVNASLNKDETGYNDEKSATFVRYGFDVVKVHQNADERTQFITEYEKSQQEFDLTLLSELPRDINGVFTVQTYLPIGVDMRAEVFKYIDYNAFFQSVIMLHDDVLEPFLAKLKDHIESIHVSLGRIESWLMEPKSNTDFLVETFGVKLETPTAEDYSESAGNTRTPHAHDLCAGCSKRLEAHYSSSSYHDSYKYRCNRHALPTFKFKYKPYKILKECDESGKFEKTFTIANNIDQSKMKKLLDYMVG